MRVLLVLIILLNALPNSPSRRLDQHSTVLPTKLEIALWFVDKPDPTAIALPQEQRSTIDHGDITLPPEQWQASTDRGVFMERIGNVKIHPMVGYQPKPPPV